MKEKLVKGERDEVSSFRFAVLHFRLIYTFDQFTHPGFPFLENNVDLFSYERY